MKILFISHWANNMLIFRTWMLQEAVRRGHDVYVLCPNDPEAKRFAELGVTHIPWTLKRGGGIGNMLSAIMDARSHLKRIAPDSTVVYCVQPIMAILCAWKFAGCAGKLYPTFTGLGSLWTDMQPAGFKKRVVRKMVERALGILLPQAEKIFVLNGDDKVQVASWNAPALTSKVEQTRGEGIDLDYFKPPTPEEKGQAKARWNIPSDAKVIGFVGRLIREKGAQDFVQLCHEFQADETLHFLVVGDPDLGNPTSLTESEMQELAAIPRLHLERWMDDVRPAYAAMDVLVFLSAREGLPITPQEAMAMGVPVVGYDSVGTREVVLPDCLVPPTRIDLITHKLSTLLQNVANTPTRMIQQAYLYDRTKIQADFLAELGSKQPSDRAPLISVITVVRNAAASIEECIVSVHSQQDCAFEHILKDGASNDGTLQILQKHKEWFAWMESAPDAGIYDAMNQACAHAKGDLVVFLNADDVFEPGALASVSKAWQSTHAEMICGAALREDLHSGQGQIVNPKKATDYARGPRWPMIAAHPAIFLSRTVFEKLGGYDLRWRLSSDYHLTLRAILSGCSSVNVSKVVARFRLHGASSQHFAEATHERAKILIECGMNPCKANALRFLAIMRWNAQRYLLGKMK